MKNRFRILAAVYSFIFYFILPDPLSAQYTNSDSSLVAETFSRTFNKEIINEYLNSGSENKIKAALLSLSHSNDTSFVPDIIKINSALYGDFISFALGQLGQCSHSTDFLLNEIEKTSADTLQENRYRTESLLENLYRAVGKTGDSLTLKSIMNNIRENNFNPTGLPMALTEFAFRGIKLANSSVHDWLISEISDSGNSIRRKSNALYALYRLGPQAPDSDIFINILRDKSFGTDKLKDLSLASLRRLKFFPGDGELFNNLLNYPLWNIRAEAAKTLCYHDFKTEDDIERYFALTGDKNPNVAKQAAVSLRELKLNEDQLDHLGDLIEDQLENKKTGANIKGELFISLCKLFKDEAQDFIEDYEDQIEKKYILQALPDSEIEPEEKYSLILNQLSPKSDEVFFLDFVPALLSVQNEFIEDEKYSKLVLSLLNSEFPSTISLTAEGIDSLFIRAFASELQMIIIEQSIKYINNPQFYESLVSLANLAERISEPFKLSILDILHSSGLYSIQKFTAEKEGRSLSHKKDYSIFSDIWHYAFKYKGATVKTNKGDFKIHFVPSSAPVSVGNFCMLAAKGFYKNVKFHRVVPNFVIQAGDPSGTGWGGPGYEIISEFSPIPFDRGAVGMASAGKDTEGSQWFVMHTSSPHLDTRYTNFALVSGGFDVVDLIDQDDIIKDIILFK